MKQIAVSSEELRLSPRARAALANGQEVVITRYGEASFVVLNWSKFSVLEPLLELLDDGIVVSPEMLMTKADIALERDLADDRETTVGEQAVIAEMLAASPQRAAEA